MTGFLRAKRLVPLRVNPGLVWHQNEVNAANLLPGYNPSNDEISRLIEKFQNYEANSMDLVDILLDMDIIVKFRQNLVKIIRHLSAMKKILVLHGPNLNLLGTREPTLYGALTLNQINNHLTEKANEASLQLTCYQSNSETDLIDTIHQAPGNNFNYIIINPAAFTHTSIALRDALSAVAIPFIEVHLSNIYSRETFRHHSYFSDIAKGIISGLGEQSYLLALQAIIEEFK